MPKIVFFPHSKEEFGSEFELRNWLDLEVRIYQRGEYKLKEAKGLGELDEGSLVFFHRNNWVVGFAIVEKSMRETTDDEKEMYGDQYKYVVKFIPESITALNDKQFIPIENIEKVIGKTIRQGYPIVEDLNKLLSIFRMLAQRTQH
jgi:hypothetical protein